MTERTDEITDEITIPKMVSHINILLQNLKTKKKWQF